MSKLVRQSERASKCSKCQMRGREGTDEALYYYKDESNGRMVLLHEDHAQHGDRCGASRPIIVGWYPTHDRYAILADWEFDDRKPSERESKQEITNRPPTPYEAKEAEQVQEIEHEISKAQNGNGGASELIEALRKAVGAVQIDEEQVRAIIAESYEAHLSTISEFVAKQVAEISAPTRVEIKQPNGEIKQLPGLVHEVFPKVLRALQTGANVMLVGPAGTGKSTIAKQCAEAMNLPFGSISHTFTMPVTEIVGYRDATGNYHDTAYRRSFELGGVFLHDELDNGNPNTTGKTNEALSNGSMEFPDKRITKHSDHYIICAMNTYGTGSDLQYVGRNQLDAAFLDRFVTIEVKIDEALEEQATKRECEDQELVTKWLTYVRKVRKSADSLRLKTVISPRASINGAKLLQAGFTWDEVVAMTVRKGISAQDWNKLNA